MALSSELISQLAKMVNTDNSKKPEPTTHKGTVVYDGKLYVRLDGSEFLTPVQSTSSVKNGDRVTVSIQDHQATITGNVTDPSASSITVERHDSKINEFDIIVAYKVTTQDLEAINATITSLKAKVANIDELDVLNADIYNLEAKFANLESINAVEAQILEAEIDKLQARIAEFENLSTEDLEAINADITNLKGYTAEFTYLSTEVLSAVKADIKELNTKKLDAESAKITYATIDFANINDAAVKKLFTDSGIIKDLVVSEGHITGELVGVTIKGDLIEAGTVKADKIVVKGSDGIYYKLNMEAGATTSEQVTEEDLQNGLSGSVIVAKSITAEKVAVDDLVAFGATIGGFNITDNAIYSGVKESALNTTRGIYFDRTGQLSVGDSNNFLRYFRADDGTYKLEISANSLVFSTHNKTIDDYIQESFDKVEIGGRNLIRNSETLIFSDYYFDESVTVDGDYIVDELGNMLLDEEDNILIV